MFKRLIVNGDTTDHRGSVSALNNCAKIGEFNMALVGDKVYCPLCNVDAIIVEGNPSHTLNGVAFAEEGHLTSCGARLVSVMQTSAAFDYDIGRVVVSRLDDGGACLADGAAKPITA